MRRARRARSSSVTVCWLFVCPSRSLTRPAIGQIGHPPPVVPQGKCLPVRMHICQIQTKGRKGSSRSSRLTAGSRADRKTDRPTERQRDRHQREIHEERRTSKPVATKNQIDRQIGKPSDRHAGKQKDRRKCLRR